MNSGTAPGVWRSAFGVRARPRARLSGDGVRQCWSTAPGSNYTRVAG
jgi:hypothetical protein